jgi:hypothetical protein
MKPPTVCSRLLVLLAAPALVAQAFQQPDSSKDRVNPNALVVADFMNRVSDYLKLHKKVNDKVHQLKPTASPEAIARHERELGHEIREAREHARPGDIFTPEISREFQRLIALAMQGSNGTRVHQSLQRAEPVQVDLRVNRAYPAGLPLQSTPPTLLANLPALAKDLEYRIVGHNLILRDVDANLIIDFITNAIP